MPYQYFTPRYFGVSYAEEIILTEEITVEASVDDIDIDIAVDEMNVDVELTDIEITIDIEVE